VRYTNSHDLIRIWVVVIRIRGVVIQDRAEDDEVVVPDGIIHPPRSPRVATIVADNLSHLAAFGCPCNEIGRLEYRDGSAAEAGYDTPVRTQLVSRQDV